MANKKANYSLSNLGLTTPEQIQDALETMAPSNAEYYLGNSMSNKKVCVGDNQIQSVTVFGQYHIIIDYDGNVMIEVVRDMVDSTGILF